MKSLPLTSLLPLAAAHALPRQGEDTWGTGLPQAREAITTMMTFYNTTAARWQPEIAWWLSGNALQTLLDYTHLTSDLTYLPLIQQTIDVQSAPLDWWPEGGGYFRADSTDDTGWWALAMTRAYDVTGNETYLAYARLDEEYMRRYWSESCGGGLIWDIPDLVYKNAISNELYFTLAAAIHNRLPGDGDGVYLDRALEAWRWFEQSGMINAEGLVNDGLTEDCRNNGAETWTYNQGVVLGGLVELYRATKDRQYLATAKSIADAVLVSEELVVDGILTEPCEAAGDCDYNAQAFKGIFMRYLGELDGVLCKTRPYREFIRANAEAAYGRDRNATGYYGVKWGGPFVEEVTIATQASAASLMLAAMDVQVRE